MYYNTTHETISIGSGNAKGFVERTGSEVATGFQYMKFILSALLKFDFAAVQLYVSFVLRTNSRLWYSVSVVMDHLNIILRHRYTASPKVA